MVTWIIIGCLLALIKDGSFWNLPVGQYSRILTGDIGETDWWRVMGGSHGLGL